MFSVVTRKLPTAYVVDIVFPLGTAGLELIYD